MTIGIIENVKNKIIITYMVVNLKALKYLEYSN